MVIVAISGTGGTGKTSAAKATVKIFNAKAKGKEKYKLVALNTLAARMKAYKGYDKARKSNIVDVKKLKTEVDKLAKKYKNIVIEGLFAHEFKADLVIILRCDPKILERRLKKKYSWPTKITENVEAEMMGMVTEEALPLHKPGTIFEIDTTKKTATQTARIVERIVKDEKDARSRHYVGNINWLMHVR